MVKFCELNPRSVYKFVTEPTNIKDSEGNSFKYFKFAGLVCGVLAEATLNSMICVRAIDAGHMTHHDFDGVTMIMEMISGNGKRLPLAVAICDVENTENYEYFIDMICSYDEQIRGEGPLRIFLNDPRRVIISDRDKGLHKAIENKLPLSLHRHCFKHIERNFLSDSGVLNGFVGYKVSGPVLTEVSNEVVLSSNQMKKAKRTINISKSKTTGKLLELLWKAHRAVRQADCERIMKDLSDLNPFAAKKLKEIPSSQWAMWTMYDQNIQLLNTSTSNDVEQEMFRFTREQIRSALPCHFFKNVADLWKRLLEEATKTTNTLLQTKQSITPYAHAELARRMQNSERYYIDQNNSKYIKTRIALDERKAASLSQFTLSNRSRNDDHYLFWKCDYEKEECTCGLDKRMTGFICEHLICQGKILHKALDANRKDFVMNKAVHKIWSAENFMSCFPSSAVLVVPGLEELSLDAFILPRPAKQTKGRKRVSRMQKGDSRKPKGKAKKAKKYLTSLYESSITTDHSQSNIHESDIEKSHSSEHISDEEDADNDTSSQSSEHISDDEDADSDTSSQEASDSDDDRCSFVIHDDDGSHDDVEELLRELSGAEQSENYATPVDLVDNEYLSFLDYYFNDDKLTIN